MELSKLPGCERVVYALATAGVCSMLAVQPAFAACVPAPAGLVGWWPGNGTAQDQAGANPGAPQGYATFAPGLAGLAFSLNGGGDTVAVPNSAILNFATNAAMSVELWAYRTNPAPVMHLLGKRAGCSATGMHYQLSFDAQNGLAFGGDYGGVNTKTQLPLNTWTHLAATFDGSRFIFYLDGQAVATNNGALGPANDQPLLIGGAGNCATFAGLLDEVAIYNRALTPGEIQGIFLAGSSGKCNAGAAGAVVPYFTDFESGAGREWLLPGVEEAETLNFSRFSGRFGSWAQTLVLTNLQVGQNYTLGFDFYAIDSWDGSSGAGDTFAVRVNGLSVLRDTFSNYNGNPPSNPQTFLRGPDEGRVNFGYNPSHVDAIYRDVEVTFTASNATTAISFSGHNLQDIGDESWGIDNVSVRLASEAAAGGIFSTRLPAEGATSRVAWDGFSISANRPLSLATATNASLYTLRAAGANGTMGDGDDLVYALAPAFTQGRTVNFTFPNAPLQPGAYRFQATGLQDTNGAAIAAFTRNFVVSHPVMGRIENTANDTQDSATVLPIEASPAGSGFYTAFASGLFTASGDVDFWRFDAEAGDRLTVRVEAEGLGVYPQVRLQNSSGGNLQNVGGNYEGIAGFQHYVFSSPGTYYLRVWTDQRRARYALRVDIARGVQMESEPNNAIGSANPIALTFSAGAVQGRVAGVLPADDTEGDYYGLLTLNTGNAISINARFPDGSTLSPGQLRLQVLAAGAGGPLATNSGATLNFTVASNAVYYLRATAATGGIRHQYVLEVAVSDGVPPQIVDTTLPAEGAATGAVLDRFTLGFSEEITPASLTNSAHFEVRGAGADGVFNANDIFYTVAPETYAGGLVANFVIADGPLQPGLTRITVRTNLIDRVGNPLSAPFVRTFTITNIPGYVLEARGNELPGRSSYFAAVSGTAEDGTLAHAGNFESASGPHFPAGGQFGGDTNLDLAVPNYYSDNLSILINDGRGNFQNITNIALGNTPVAVAVARFNNDARSDLAVANYNANTVTIVLATDSGFVVATNLSGFSRPYQLAAGDVNGDGRADLIVPNYNGNNVRVLLGNGDGTFQSGTNYPTPDNPMQVAIGNLNGDAFPDLAVANYSGTVSVLPGNGNGTFQAAQNLPAGRNTRSVAIADVTGDSLPDLVSVSAYENTLNVFQGHGNGTFDARRDYPNGTADAYQVALGDWNGDGRLDAVVPGYGNNTYARLLNNGAGVFTNLLVLNLNQNPLGAVVGDFDADGRTDLVLSRFNGGGVSLFLGNAQAFPAEDPPGSGLRTGFARGNLTQDSDVDYFRFTGTAGDVALVAVEVPDAPPSSGIRIEVYRPDGEQLTSFNTTDRGWGQSGVFSLPHTGAYLVRVTYWYGYRGEYRVRVTTARPPVQFETEDNNTIAGADAPVYALTNGHLQATLAGYLNRGDGAGDFYYLGVLPAGGSANLKLRQPATSGFAGIFTIFNQAGQFLTNSAAGATNFTFYPPTGSADAYYARLTADPLAPAPTIGGQPGNALLLDGSDDYVRVTDSPSLRPVNLTLEAWVNFSAVNGVHVVCAKGLGTGDDDAYALWYHQGQLHGYIAGGPTLGFNWAPELGRWYHVAYVFDDAANAHLLYLDGQLVASGNNNASISYDARPLFIGADVVSDNPTYFFPGKIDEVRVWNAARASNEIAAASSQRLNGTEPGLAAYWRLDEGAGLTTADATANGNQGTLVNGPVWTASSLTQNRPLALAAQYLLDFDLVDAASLQVTGVNLPAEGVTVSNLWQSFTVSFNQELDARINQINRAVLSYGGSRYFVSDRRMSWFEAESYAVTFGAHLVTIDQAAENTWVWQNYSGYADFWIGLNDLANEGVYQWASGQPVVYTNWTGGQPDNNGGADAVWMDNNSARWLDDAAGGARWAVFEIPATPDTDGDGLPNGIDLFANDPRNGLELRSAGPNGLFDDADDLVYNLDTTGYTSGTNLSLNVVDGPLQPGAYRFTVSTAFRDRFGNTPAAPYVRNFTIAPVNGYVMEGRNNGSRALATTISSAPGGGFDGSFTLGQNTGVGQNPHFLLTTNLNADAQLDLLVANYSGDTVSVLLGQADGSWQLRTNQAVGDGPVGLAVADFNGDGRKDLAVAQYNANTLGIQLGDGTGAFTLLTNYATPRNPYYLSVGDLNKDGKIDIVTGNHSADNVSIFLGNGDGTFQPSADVPAGDGAAGSVIADLNADGQPDLVVGNRYANTVTVLLGNGTGSFITSSNYAVSGGNPFCPAVADLNADGALDVVVMGNATLNFFPGLGDGTLGPAVTANIGASDAREVDCADLDGNGLPDLIVPSYGNSRLITVLNLGNGQFGNGLTYAYSGNPISAAAGDFNQDGRLDIATANYQGDSVQILLGSGSQPLAADATTGLRNGGGRGALFDENDNDYWTFSARANDRLTLAVESVGALASSGLRYLLYNPDGSQLADFYPANNGVGEYSAALGAPGTYSIRVLQWHAYRGEYRFRVTLAPPPLQYESEENDSVTSADPVNFALEGGFQKAGVFGYLRMGDPGDLFRLGNLSEGTAIRIRASRPATSRLEPWLSLYDAAGALVTNGAPGETTLEFMVGAGKAGAYFARIQPAYAARGAAETALLFNGGNQYVNTGGWQPGKQWTVQAWVMPLAYPSGRRGIAGSYGGCQDWGLCQSDGRFGMAIRPWGGACSQTLAAPELPALGAWRHVAAVCDGTNATLYVDGSAVAAGPVATDYAPTTSGTWFGGEACCGSYFPGFIQYVSIWNRALTSAEIITQMSGTLVGSEPNLVGFWPLDEGAGNTAADLSAQGRQGNLVNGPAWTPLASPAAAGPGLYAEYRLDLELGDTAPPFVADASLPAGAAPSTALIDRFSLTFSEDLAPATVTNSANYELRNAGPNGTFGNADDALYTVLNSPAYASGLTGSFLIADGPLQPGNYRFTAYTNLTDTSGSRLVTNFTRFFSVTGVPGYLAESRTNGARNLATTFSLGPVGGPDGSLSTAASLSVPGDPEYLAAGHLNNDTNLDLVIPSYGNSTISVFLGNGDGTFQWRTNFAGQNGGLMPVLGRFNNDAHLDLAVGNYQAQSVSIYFGAGDGTFARGTNYTVGTRPVGMVTGDFNNDGRADLACVNYNSDNVSVLIGNGDGTFKSAVNYPAGANPHGLTTGEFNGDGRLDLVTANYGSDNLTLLLGNGDGTFTGAGHLAVNASPRGVAAADLNNDSRLDLVSANYDSTVSVLWGNGDGTFQTRVNFPTGAQDQYVVLPVDMNADGQLDLVVSSYGQDRVSLLLNRGGGQFESPSVYGVNNGPIGLAAGDFNQDSRTDIAVIHYGSDNLLVLQGNDTEPLPSDGAGGLLFTGRGRGNLYNNADQDYWSFTANAGDSLHVSIYNPGNPNGTTRLVEVYRPDGARIDYFYSDYNGRGSWSGTAAASGTHTVRVTWNDNYNGEYRLAVWVVKAPLQVEYENNDNYNQANTLTFAAQFGSQTARVFGTVLANDDYFRLGNLAAGTTVRLTLERPASSIFSGTLAIYKGASLVTNSPVDATNLVLLIPAGGGDNYYARVSPASGAAGQLASYILNVDLTDLTPPAITSVTLPAGGAISEGISDHFEVGFNKDLDSTLGALSRPVLRYGGHAYLMTETTLTWNQAQAQARALGGHLVTINDASENAWVRQNFGGTIWIGLTDEAQEGSFAWASGEPFAYTNWNSGEPNNSGNEDYASMLDSGRWNDVNGSTSYRGVIEVSGVDTDGDGLPDSVDPLPNDPLNLFDLRAAGADGLFDTGDDVVYGLSIGSYAGGLSLSFAVSDGPLQPGSYRFRVSTSLRDRFGNGLPAPFDQFFTITDLPPYAMENRDNQSAAGATALVLVESPTGLRSGFGRGKLFDNNDVDYWGFDGLAGEVLTFATDVPGRPGASQLHYEVYNPSGQRVVDFYPEYTGNGEAAPLTLTNSGAYVVRVTYNYSYHSEYRLRVSLASPPLQAEKEANDTIATANPLTLAASGESRFASVHGSAKSPADLDYYHLGPLTNGSSVFLSVRLPNGSTYVPVVSLYDSANRYQEEAGGGSSGDSVAEVRITTTGTYIALVRGGNGANDPQAKYVLDVQVVPTGAVSFPNLVVSSVTPPVGTPSSGQTVTFRYAVTNAGALATPVASWLDRAAFSANTVLGDTDDIPLGFFPRTGVLQPGAVYSVTNTFTLPEGLSGDYYLIVQADAGNAVNEFVFEADNITVSPATFHVNRAPYPDLKVESLGLSGPDSQGTYTVTWTAANRGNAAAPAGFRERFLVRNLTTGATVASEEQAFGTGLPVNGTLPRLASVTTTNAGNYQVEVTIDSQNAIYEFDAVSHASAEMNTAVTNFLIAQFYQVTVAANPPAAGLVTGGGNYLGGTAVTVAAAAVTNELPYYFVNWSENGVFQSGATNYSFSVTRNRALTANFTLPAYSITASNAPPAGGTVSGQGAYFHGATNVLTAVPNAGYRFTNWTEQGQVISQLPLLTNMVTSNRFVVANYFEANTFHVVTMATVPADVAALTGAGHYLNGQSVNFTAPVAITNAPFVYFFREWRINGALAANNPAFTKVFSTLDPTNLALVAHYDATTLLPVVTNVIVNVTNPVPATTNFVIALQFNRSMRSAPEPLVTLTNPAAVVQAVVPAGGVWSTRAVSNDTYSTPAITFGPGMDGTNRIGVSRAQDLAGFAIALTNVGLVAVDVTPPSHPALTLTASNNSSATVSWTAYAAPSDLGGFRVYLATNSFTSVTGLSLITRLNAGARSYTYAGLELDRTYYAAIAAVDVAGNSPAAVTPFAFTLPSSVPPPVAIQVAPVDGNSAQVSWNAYNTSALLGFAGFRLYYEETNFTSVAGLAVRQALGPGVRSAQVENLDRTKQYFFAVVGYNGKDAFNPNVTTARWTDPYAGNIAANLTLGGAGDVVDIYQSITVVSNAVLTIPAGTTLRFAPGTGLSILNGRLVAQGTALDPIVFTAAADREGMTPAAGSWNGLVLSTNAGAAVLRHVFVNYGAGLTLDGCSPTIEAFSALYNTPSGLSLKNGARLNTAEALVLFNGVGLRQTDTAQLTIRNSVIKNNQTNGWAAGSANLIATQNWWGTALAAEIDALLAGSVDRNANLAGEPLLTPAIGLSNNVTQVGSRQVNVKLACRTAEAARLSENSTFPAAFFQPYATYAAFQLSEGGGEKVIFAQFRSLTGQTSAPVSVTITYITDGPRITGFNLAEGQTLTRPAVVTGAATAPLGMATMEFYVNTNLHSSVTGGNFSAPLDARLFDAGIYRVRLVARDTSGNFAVLERNVTFAPTPPPAPVITQPASDLTVNSNTLNVAGTAEPQVEVRLSRGGVIVGSVIAGANGAFSFANIPLLEGANDLVATAIDTVGSARSALRVVVLDSGPPASLAVDPPLYRPGLGLSLTWRHPAEGERAARFQVFWHTAPFSATNQATGRSILLQNMDYALQGLANTNYYFAVMGFDSAGNASPLSELVSYQYDSLPPVMNVAFDKPSPVGTGKLRIVLTANEPLAETPRLTIRPNNSTPQTLTLSNSALNTYEAALNITPGTASGLAVLNVGAVDLVGNAFNGVPLGSELLIDVTPPAGAITTAPVAPIQVTNLTEVAVNLALTEPAKAATTPVLSFVPPAGAPVTVTLNGTGTNWNGAFTLNPSMGSGNGLFLLSVKDQLDNEGHGITSGSTVEIYNTALPSPPMPPANFRGTLLPGGAVRLTWNAVSNAEMYQLYSEPGTNGVPTVLVASGITNTIITNLPPAEGFYRFAATASRRGSESTNSDVVIAYCDRTPPPAPTGLALELAATGIQITWQKGAGENPHHYNVYRNGTLIRTVPAILPVVDVPPRGTINYTVAAADQTGNEAFSEPAAIELLVGPVNNLQVMVNPGQAPILTWTGSDPTAVSYNVYRNGIKQNATPISAQTFTDTLPIGGDVVEYAVRAVNAGNQESLPRPVTVYPVALQLLANNAASASSGSLILNYFDQYEVALTNLATNATLALSEIELRRTGGGDPRTAVVQVDGSVGPAQSVGRKIVFPGATVLAAQAVRVRAVQETDFGGSSVIYQANFDFPDVANPGVMLEITANQLPLAGGLADFEVQVFNRGFADLELVVASGRGANPGELYVSVKDPQGQEVSRGYFQGTPTGTKFTADGRAYLTVPPGNSTRLTVAGVLVPESLSSNALITFEAALDQIYHRIGEAGQLVSGPLRGSMRSALTQTEYYGVAQTDRTSYPNTVPVVITGQAIRRSNGQPVPNATLKIGFATRGFNWDVPVETDASGNFRYEYNAPPGLSGSLSLWAAHPDVYDVLNQARITLFRVYASPARGDIRMSKNDTLQFRIALINPGDIPLTGFSVAARVYRLEGTNRVPVSSITGSADRPEAFTVGAGETRNIELRLTSTLEAPDNALVEFTIQSAEGAAADFTGNLTLLPAVPVLAVVNPPIGYLEANVDRGGVLSRQVTVANRGLRDLQGIELIPPTNLTWLIPNLAVEADGKIRLPDIPVGGSNTFTVVFSPPTDAPLGQTNDYLLIQGTNSPTPFRINLYPLVTSNKKGAAQFYVDNVLGLPVPDATIRLRSAALQVEIPPVKTDANGYVTVPDLQEGYWSWLITAPGHSSAVGVVEVIPSQTVLVEPPATRLNKSVVTVTFRVEPVPFTDRYEIKIEQTFETHVPLPVLVLTPPALEFRDVKPGFEANFVVKAKNHGLIEMFDVKVTGMDAPSGRLEPLITFFPVLRPFEEVEIPFRLVYLGAQGGQQGLHARQLGGFPVGCGGGDLPSLADTLAGMNAMVQGNSLCAAGGALLAVAQGLLIALYIWQTQINKVYKYAYKLATLLTCLGLFSGGGGGSGPGGGGGPSSGTYGNWGLGNPVCFAAGTQVTMADGTTKPIELIRTNDVVRTGQTRREAAAVVETSERVVDHVREIRYRLESGAPAERSVRTTDDHLFWIDGQGWTPARNLAAGQWLTTERGARATIVACPVIQQSTKVYTLKAREDHVFYANGVLVHDQCGEYYPMATAAND